MIKYVFPSTPSFFESSERQLMRVDVGVEDAYGGIHYSEGNGIEE